MNTSNLKRSPSPTQTIASLTDYRTRKLGFYLPNKLPRHGALVTEERVATFDPLLEGIPVPYIIERVQENLIDMQLGLSSIVRDKGLSATSNSPSSMTVSLNHAHGMLPTHILVAIDAKTRRAETYSMHPILYAVHCATVPLPRDALSCPATSEICIRPNNFSKQATLPLVHLTVPHLASFHILHAALYNNGSTLLRHLLPTIPLLFCPEGKHRTLLPSLLEYPNMRRRVMQSLVKHYKLPALIEAARFIHGFWRNCVALGVKAEDQGMIWGPMEEAWWLVLSALTLRLIADEQ